MQVARLEVQPVEIPPVLQRQLRHSDELRVAVQLVEHFHRQVQRLDDDLFGAGHHLVQLEVPAQDQVLDRDRQELLQKIPTSPKLYLCSLSPLMTSRKSTCRLNTNIQWYSSRISGRYSCSQLGFIWNIFSIFTRRHFSVIGCSFSFARTSSTSNGSISLGSYISKTNYLFNSNTSFIGFLIIPSRTAIQRTPKDF